ncbi:MULTISPECIES: zinc-dependent alcohol dehydrogenase [unclassified Sphingobium]|uniref:zinc-dependent alcohol dehydrogenase n=1 Tax=unclassified Sphingobium TaxID=2611147 RepID=UPI001A1601B5|nr:MULTISPECIES: zinc-binding dehydrogenase [unclassified Sphingobium]CAD7340686.1 Sorbitol dehydrogenase [Sphingobium sp. S6]CAD7340691.1 Sorbitol dehydrogenase [Sphingobium sp. S8]
MSESDGPGLSLGQQYAATMPLVRVHGVGDMRVDQVPVPEVGPRDVLVRISATGVCGSDLGYVAAGGLGGGAPLIEPLPIGHEFAGIVEKVGEQVSGIRPGQRCAVNPDAGLIGGGGPAGAFAPFILIPDARAGADICPIPDSLPLEKAALAEPLSVGLHGVNIGRVQPGEKVVILGAGPIGLCTIICLRHRGVEDILVADLSDARLERARQLGAAVMVNPSREPLVEAVGKAHGTGERFGMPYVGSDVIIDAAGAQPPLAELLDVAKFRARIVIVALHKKPMPINLWKMMANEFSISGSIATDREDEFNECLQMLASGDVNIGPLISHRVDFAQLDEAFRIAADTDASAKVIVTFPQTA